MISKPHIHSYGKLLAFPFHTKKVINGDFEGKNAIAIIAQMPSYTHNQTSQIPVPCSHLSILVHRLI
jgi:hypothetical protein